MSEIATTGLDIAKNVFQIHGVDRSGQIVLRRALRRSQVPGFFKTLSPCLIGMEACATAHHWARRLMVFGHDVRLIPPAYVKPYLRYKTVIGRRLHARTLPTQKAEAAAGCKVINIMSRLGMPVARRVI